jgi:RNA polymerase sigma-70 factor, ECF subfamily
VALADRAAFARVYELTNAHLFGIAQRMLGNRQLAEDVLQEAFVSVWKNASSYNSDLSQPMTWLIAIVRNRTLDMLRAKARRVDEVSSSVDYDNPDADESLRQYDVADDSGEPSVLLDRAADAMQIRACMDSLDARIRQSLALAYYQGLSNTEVASHLSSPLGSVKTWLRRGLQQLKSCIDATTTRSPKTGGIK